MKHLLQEDEKQVYHCERVDLAIYQSAPMIHAAGTIPGLHTIELLVTDRRVIVTGAVLGGVPVAEFGLWYARACPSGECDVLEQVSVGRDPLGGRYLHLIARARAHGPLRSDTVHLYLYVDEAERLARMLNHCMQLEPLDWR
jgi:hypothetical protein